MLGTSNLARAARWVCANWFSEAKSLTPLSIHRVRKKTALSSLIPIVEG
jgi:hypothetical protein